MPAQRLTEVPTVEATILRQPAPPAPGVLRINGETYVFSAFADEVRTGFKLYPAWATVPYETWETVHGLHGCTCLYFELRGMRHGRACKHVAGLAAAGLFKRLSVPVSLPGCDPAAKPMESAL